MRETAYAQLEAAYLRYLGRKGTPEEYESHFGGDYSDSALNRAVGFVSRSPEATEYANRPAPGPTPGATSTDPFESRPQAGEFGRTEGFDAKNWGSMNSVKYRAGEILARYPSTPEGLKQALNDPDFKKLFPNAKLVGFDTIDFGGILSDFDRGVPVGKVDVGRAFDVKGNTGGAWVWQDLANTGGSLGGASDKWKYSGKPAAPPGAPPAPPGAPPPGPGDPDPGRPRNDEQQMFMGDFAQANQPQLGQSAFQAPNPDDLFMSDLERQRASRIGKYARV